MFITKFLLNYFFAKDIVVIIDLFRHKNIQTGVISYCYDDNTALLMNKIFISNELKISGQRVVQNQKVNIPNAYRKVGIVVNTSCEGWNNVFNINKDAFKSPFVWFIVSKNLTETTDVLSRYKIEVDSDVMIISKKENIYVFSEIFYTGFHKNAQLIIREIGLWKVSLRLVTRCRKDLKGLVLRSTVVLPLTTRVVNKTFVRFLEEEQPDLIKVDPLHKFKYFAVLQYFRDMFNVTYEFLRTNSWGYQTNGTFDGMVGTLQRGEADIGGSPLYVRADRAEAIDYASEAWVTRLCFIFRHPKHPGGYFSIYTRPLANKVWSCIGALMAVSITMLGFLLKLNVIKTPGDHEDASLSLAFLFIWSTLCQQGMSISRNSASVKVVVFVTFIFALTLYQYYNATVVSTLLRDPPKNIRTLKDLLNSDLQAGVEDVLYNRDYFKHTTDPVIQEIYKKKIARNIPYNYFLAGEGIAMVKKGGFAFNIETAVAYRLMRRTFTEKQLCELQEVNMNVPQMSGAAVQKRSPYKEIVAYGMRKMMESGILARLKSLWDEARPVCVRNPDSSMISVSILEFSTPLIVLVVGYVTASMVLLGEIFVRKAETRKMIEFKH